METETVYCAFLRGINVNGRNMKMPDICTIFEQAGMKNASSVLATGNIIFDSGIPQGPLRRKLENALSEHYACDVHLFIKDVQTVEAILNGSPFSPDPDLHIYAFICDNGFETVLLDVFHTITPTPRETAAIKNGYFYWQVRKGSTLDAGYSKILSRKDIKDKFTSRNLNTIQKIHTKIQAIKS